MEPDRLAQLRVMGLPVHHGADYATWLLGRLRRGQGSHVVTLNAEMSMQADHNPGWGRCGFIFSVEGASFIALPRY